jgi:gamma-glutamylcysteine synthetase
MDWMYIESTQRPASPPTVALEYQSERTLESVYISQSDVRNRGSVFDELTRGPGWAEVVRDGEVIHIAKAANQAQVHLERAGTFVFLMSETLTVQQVAAIAAGLVPGPGYSERSR